MHTKIDIMLRCFHAHASPATSKFLPTLTGGEAMFLFGRGWLKKRLGPLNGGDESHRGSRTYLRLCFRVVDGDKIRTYGALGHKKICSCKWYASVLGKRHTSHASANDLKQWMKDVAAYQD